MTSKIAKPTILITHEALPVTQSKRILTRILSKSIQSCRTWWISCRTSSAHTRFPSTRWPDQWLTSKSRRKTLKSKRSNHSKTQWMVQSAQGSAIRCLARSKRIWTASNTVTNISRSRCLNCLIEWTILLSLVKSVTSASKTRETMDSQEWRTLRLPIVWTVTNLSWALQSQWSILCLRTEAITLGTDKSSPLWLTI